MDSSYENQLKSFRVRPRFQIESIFTGEELNDRINTELKNSESCLGSVMAGHVTLYLPVNEQHYWSPQLSLSIEDTENGCLIRGLYGPRPSVWTMFVFIYFIIGLATTFITSTNIWNFMRKEVHLIYVFWIRSFIE